MRAIGAVLLWLLASGCSQSAAEPAASRRQSASVDPTVFEGRISLKPGDRRNLPLPGGERRPIDSLLAVPSPLRYGQFVWNDVGVPTGRPWIRIDLTTQTLSVFRGKHEIGTAVILYGADSHVTPSGRFPILAKFEEHRSSIYGAAMPFTLKLTGDGVAIHGSDVRYDAATHGCIGIPEAFAKRLFAATSSGDLVYIISDRNDAELSGATRAAT